MRSVIDMFDAVEVPDLVGPPFEIASEIARRAELTLTNTDQDSTPISVLAWPGPVYVASQQPTAGSFIPRRAGIGVEIEKYGDEQTQGARLLDPAPVPPLSADAAAKKSEHFFDLTAPSSSPLEVDRPILPRYPLGIR